MKLSELKNRISTVNELIFCLPDGSMVPAHFHITEVGLLTRNFIDCGGQIREEKHINLQLWYADDTEHRLSPSNLHKIIEKSEKLIDLGDYTVEFEYQMESISKFGIEFKQNQFHLTPKHTACLAEDQCGIPTNKPKKNLRELNTVNTCCTPGSNCC